MQVIDAVEEERYRIGEVIIKQGESGTNFYLLEVILLIYSRCKFKFN